MKHPFYLVSWHNDFLETLLEHVKEQGKLSQSIIIVPHSRPELYLQQILRRDDLPLILPNIFSVKQLFSTLREHVCHSATTPAGTLDCIGLLMQAVRTSLHLPDNAQNLLGQKLARSKHTEIFLQDAQFFFPWGVRLADLFEECLNHHCTPKNFQYMEGEVVPFAATLLDNLGSIFNSYVQSLKENNWSTSGLDASQVISAIKTGQALPEHIFKGKKIYIAGFNALTKTQELLFKYLHEEHEAQFVVHADPKLLQNTAAHWSCQNFSVLAKNWQCSFEEIIPKNQPIARHEPNIKFVSGFDVHSQLENIAQTLQDEKNLTLETREEQGYSAATVIVLPDSALLMPVLHHLPDEDCNISMGYPLNRSPVFILLSTVFNLQEKRMGQGYYWKNLLELLRHPYLKMLSPQTSDASATGNLGKNETPEVKQDLRKELHQLERMVREHGQTYLAPFELLNGLRGSMLEASTQHLGLLEKLLHTCLTCFEGLQSTKDVGKALENLCALLLEHGEHLWQRFPIDAECLHRLLQALIPELLHNSLAEEKFPSSALFDIIRKLIDTQRVPFRASPLVGLQIMGMLETRLLSFKNVFILQATDSNLPGESSANPLLPDSLRPLLGLPPRHSRESVAAYNFFRLINCAQNVTLAWQEGGSGLQDQIPQKSRFIEELLWEQEKKQNRLFKTRGEDENLHFLESKISSFSTKNSTLIVDENIRELIQKRLLQPVSASFLDSYLKCPVKWYYENIAKLNSPEDIAEKNDPRGVGNLLHSSLQTFHTSFVGQQMPAFENDENTCKALINIFEEELQKTSLLTSLPADALAMLKASATIRLKLYLQNQPNTKIIALEKKLITPFTVLGEELTLEGRVDRIDVRNETLLVLDYKTGYAEQPKQIWGDEAFWQKLESWISQNDKAETLLNLSANIPSIQLAFYILLLQKEQKNLLESYTKDAARIKYLDAAYVDLRETGREINFLPELPDAQIPLLYSNINILMDFLLRHMQLTPELSPHKTTFCHWCSLKKMCMVLCK